MANNKGLLTYYWQITILVKQSLSVEITWENFLADVFWTNMCGSWSRPDEEADHGKGLNKEQCRGIISSNGYIWTILFKL